MIKLKAFIFLCLCCPSLFSFAATWHTVASGYWSQPSIWQGGIVPPATSSDSIYFHHDIGLTHDITLTNGGFMKVDSTGGICGHITLTIGVNASMVKYGYCQIDTLKVPGGQVDFFPPGFSIFAMWGQISNGGSFSLNGSGLTVGQWFQCAKGPAGWEEDETNSFQIYPNPFSEVIYITGDDFGENEITIYNSLGTIVSTENNAAQLSTSHLPCGIYMVEIKQADRIIRRQLIKMTP